MKGAVPSSWRLRISEYSGVEEQPLPSTATPSSSIPDVRLDANDGQLPEGSALRMACAGELRVMEV